MLVLRQFGTPPGTSPLRPRVEALRPLPVALVLPGSPDHVGDQGRRAPPSAGSRRPRRVWRRCSSPCRRRKFPPTARRRVSRYLARPVVEPSGRTPAWTRSTSRSAGGRARAEWAAEDWSEDELSDLVSAWRMLRLLCTVWRPRPLFALGTVQQLYGSSLLTRTDPLEGAAWHGQHVTRIKHLPLSPATDSPS